MADQITASSVYLLVGERELAGCCLQIAPLAIPESMLQQCCQLSIMPLQPLPGIDAIVDICDTSTPGLIIGSPTDRRCLECEGCMTGWCRHRRTTPHRMSGEA